MPRIIQTTVFQFDELSDKAKDRAREWYRTASADDTYWYENVFDDAKECLKLAGFRIDRIYFSGFSSQGDGACFEGTWGAEDAQPVKAMKQHAPQDKRLHAIAADARQIARQSRDACARIKHRGHYYHEYETVFDCHDATLAVEDAIIEMSRDAMRWIYHQLQTEYEYQQADEQVDESIRANEYEFTAEGRRA